MYQFKIPGKGVEGGSGADQETHPPSTPFTSQRGQTLIASQGENIFAELSLNIPPDYASIHQKVESYLNHDAGPLNLPLLGLQKKSVAHLTAMRYGLLWDDMGLGKTAQCIAINAMSHAGKTLIFCPNNIKKVWVAEITKFTHHSPASIYVGKGSDLITLTHRLLDRFKYFIFNYETLRVAGKTPKIRPAIFDAVDHVILDEAHHFRNSYIQDFITFYRHLEKRPPPFLTISTGTPIDRFMGEVWPYLMLMDLNPAVREKRFHAAFPNQELFNEEFAHLRGQKKNKKDQLENSYAGYNEANFHAIPRMLKNHVVRREITDIGEMPKLHTADVFIPNEHFNVNWDEVLQKFAWLAQLQHANKKKHSDDEIDTIAAIQKMRTDIAIRKGWFTVQSTLQYLNQGPLVLFSEFIKPLKEMQHWFFQAGHESKIVCGTGMSLAEREANIDNFKKEKFQILLATFGAMSEGENLQVSNFVAFNDLPWQPLRLLQAQRRVWRIGQKRECYNLTMLCKGDEFVRNVVLKKQDMISLLDGEMRKIQYERGLL